MILTVCRQTVGALDAFAIEAEEHEASVAAKVERVARIWPREAGIEWHWRAIGGAVVTLLVGLVVAYLSFEFGW
jgi:hypothetical protein